MTRDDPAFGRLAGWLASRGGAQAGVTLQRVEALGGGQSSGMLLLYCQSETGADIRYVLRKQSTSPIFQHPDIVREFNIVRALGQAGAVPTPTMRWVEPDPAILGAPFLIMDFVDGFAPLGKPSMHVAGPLPALTEAVRARMGQSGIEALAAIHRTDWRRTLPFLQASTGQALDEHLDRLGAYYRWAAEGGSYPITDAALAYLFAQGRALDPGPPCLIWNDARVGNILFTPQGDVAAIIDWEVAGVGPAAIDLGFWLMMEEFHSDAVGVVTLPGWPSRAALIACYRAGGGDVPGDLDYFIIMAALFMATTLVRQERIEVADGRLKAGSTLGRANTATQMLAMRLGLPVPDLSPDYTARRGLPAGTRPRER